MKERNLKETMPGVYRASRNSRAPLESYAFVGTLGEMGEKNIPRKSDPALPKDHWRMTI